MKPFDMRLVDDGVFPRDVSPPIFATPIEIGIDDDGLGHEGRAVALVEGQVVALGSDRVAENRGVPCQLSRMGSRVRVEQQLVGIKAVAGLGLIRAVHTKAIKRRRADLGHMTVEDFVGVLRELEPVDLSGAVAVEEANLDPGRVG